MINDHPRVHRSARCLGAITITLLAGSASAGGASQAEPLRPDDAAEFDGFGNAVALDGSTMIIGASNKAGASGFPTGAAYLFDADTGDQMFRLIPSESFAIDFFGFSVSISGTRALVGAPRPFGHQPTQFGAAYLFDTTTGVQLDKLESTDNSLADAFGSSVSIDGDFAAIGSPNDSDNGAGSGSAYLFHVPTGIQFSKLLPDDGAAEDMFGAALAINGNTAIVGATGDDDNGSVSGSAYLFDVLTGNQLFKLKPDDGDAGDRFGSSVAISGNIAIVGASGDQDNGANSGSAYLFDTTTGGQLFKLMPSDGGVEHRFGCSVSISGTTAIVGARGHDDHGQFSGAVYLFDTTTGQQTRRFFSDAISTGDEFGFAASIKGNNAMVGAFQESNDFANDGTVYLFDISACGASDINGDFTIDTADIGILVGQFGTAGPAADINGDGIVDTADLGLLLNGFGSTCP